MQDLRTRGLLDRLCPSHCNPNADCGWGFQTGQLTPIDLIVEERFHRSAPRGMGGTKAAGNYSPVRLLLIAQRTYDVTSFCSHEQIMPCGVGEDIMGDGHITLQVVTRRVLCFGGYLVGMIIMPILMHACTRSCVRMCTWGGGGGGGGGPGVF
jgi:hypothetical protein